MFTAKVASKTIEANGVVAVNVIFTDGVSNIPETVRPQDDAGFKYWVKARLTALNAAPVIQSTYADGATIDTSDPVVVPPVLSQNEIDFGAWYPLYQKWIKVKTTLIDTGVLTGAEAPIVALQNNVKAGFKAGFLTLM